MPVVTTVTPLTFFSLHMTMEEMLNLVMKRELLVTKRKPRGMVAEGHGLLSSHNTRNWNIIHKHLKRYLFHDNSWASKQISYHRHWRLFRPQRDEYSCQSFKSGYEILRKCHHWAVHAYYFKCLWAINNQLKKITRVSGRNESRNHAHLYPTFHCAKIWRIFFFKKKKINWS